MYEEKITSGCFLLDLVVSLIASSVKGEWVEGGGELKVRYLRVSRVG